MTYLPPFSIPLFSYLNEKDKKKLLINYQHYVTKENDSRFLIRENWAIERLIELEKKRVIKDEENRLTSIRDALEDNRLELDSLLMSLEEMRDE